MDLLTIEHLAVSLGNARILKDVNISVGAGERVGLVGPNGAGKTTTLRTLSGLNVAEKGSEMRFLGDPLPGNPRATVRKGLVHVPEGRQLLRGLTVRDNLRLGCYAAGVSFSDQASERILERFPELGPLYRSRAAGLSGGELQMAAIARGLLAQPKLLMVDELSLGLSPKASSGVLKALIASSEAFSMGLLLVDQNVRALTEVCDHVYLMREGHTELVSKSDVYRGSTGDLYYG